MAAINYLAFALFPILMLGGMMCPLAAAGASAGRILEILETEPEVKQAENTVRPERIRGRISFKNLFFSHFAEEYFGPVQRPFQLDALEL